MLGESVDVYNIDCGELTNGEGLDEGDHCWCYYCFPCLSYNSKRRNNKSSDQRNKKHNNKYNQRKVRYLPVISSSPQLTSCSSSSSSSSPATSSSSVSLEGESKKLSKMTSPNDNTAEPSAPPSGLVLFNSEEQSDIVFLVGSEPDPIWRFPAHSFVVKDVSPVFRAIVESGSEGLENPQRCITCCKPEIFHVILRYIYTKDISISSVSSALAIFAAADQFLLYDIQRHCLTFLYDNCHNDNVLQMISHFSHYSHLRLNPLLNGDIGSNQSVGSRQQSISYDNILNELITKCYRTLDSDAEIILRSEEFENLEHELMTKILSRDCLKLSSELEVFDSIMRWACQQCKRQRREITCENKRDVLGKAIYCPRYLVMTADEFMRGPYISDMLTDDEKCALLDRLVGNNGIIMPVHLSGRKLDIPRKYEEPINGNGDNNCGNGALSVSNDSDTITNGQGSGVMVNSGKKKVSASKKLLNGLGDIVVCVIQLLD